MPKFLEKKLKQEYGSKSNIPYKIMNKMGAMKGNKETEMGKSMEAKHRKDMAMKMEATRVKQRSSKY
ncbi:MAG: hypothetical protein HYZ54_13650 [Ignavibacteriae bacterium]|nr:hypothetical protein [Ignavibacteriota bacterium]